MQTSPLLLCKPVKPAQPTRGFTLLELLVVLVVISLATGLIVVRGTPGDSRYLEMQAEKLSQILRIAQQHALLKSRPLRLMPAPGGYTFEEFDADRWRPVEKEPLLRERQWESEEVRARFIESGREVPFLVIDPRPGLIQQEVILQLNRTALRLSRSATGQFKAGPIQKVIEDLALAPVEQP